MPFDDHSPNFAYSLVATAPSPATTGVSLVVTAGQGALFPTPPFNATIWPASTQPLSTNAEIVRVTAISTDTLTIKRAQESSTARTVIVGDQIAATVTAKTLTDVEAGFSPDLAVTTMVGLRDQMIPALTSAYCGAEYELGTVYGPTRGSNTGIQANKVIASPVTLVRPLVIPAVNVTAIVNTLFASAGNMRVGVYTDSAGAPGALLCQSPPVAFLSADSVCRLIPAAVEVSGTVWLAVQTDADINIDMSTTSQGGFARIAALYTDGLPDPFGTPTLTSTTTTMGIYALIDAYATEIGADAVLEIG